MRGWNTSRKEFDKVSCFQDSSRVKCLSGGLDGHATLYKIKGAGDTALLQRLGYQRPYLSKIYFSILWEQADERGFFRECTADIIGGFEFFNLFVPKGCISKEVACKRSERNIPSTCQYHLYPKAYPSYMLKALCSYHRTDRACPLGLFPRSLSCFDIVMKINRKQLGWKKKKRAS